VDLNLKSWMRKNGLSPMTSRTPESPKLIVRRDGENSRGTVLSVRLNSSLPSIEEFNNLPIKTVTARRCYIKDVATVKTSSCRQTKSSARNGAAAAADRSQATAGRPRCLWSRGKGHAARVMSTSRRELKLADIRRIRRSSPIGLGGVVRETLIAANLTA